MDKAPREAIPAGLFHATMHRMTEPEFDDEDDGEEPGKPDPVLEDILTNRSPPPQRVLDLARSLVDRAHLRFKNFREDRERIENGAVQASRAEGHISPKEARDIFMDKGDCVSLPLVERYIEAREFELVFKYLKHQMMYQPTDWLTPRNRIALEGMIKGGEQPMAVALLREYLKRLRGNTQRAWRNAGRKKPPELPLELGSQFDRQKEIAERELPGKLEIAEMEMAEIELWLKSYGSREDNRALDKFRDELAKVRERFGID